MVHYLYDIADLLRIGEPAILRELPLGVVVYTPTRHYFYRRRVSESELALLRSRTWGRPVYLRVGDVPKDGLSRHRFTGVIEPGVSVFEALVGADGLYRVVGPDRLKIQFSTYMLDRPVYLVEGDFVGLGSDDEPCLKNVSVVGLLASTEIKVEDNQ